jgi:hypothetical protein
MSTRIAVGRKGIETSFINVSVLEVEVEVVKASKHSRRMSIDRDSSPHFGLSQLRPALAD